MAINQHASNLVDLTARAFNGNVTSISPTDGISLIDSWITFLKSDDQAGNSVATTLNELKTELQSDNPDGAHVQQILADLASQTKEIATSADSDSKPELNTLAKTLEGFSQQISGVSGPAATGGQAPMTSTVGGESTTRGTGASAFGATDDDLSNRTGGTISDESADDTTEGNGRSVTSGSSEGDDYSNSSQRDSGQLSRSDTSRMSGMGVSGGTGDTDSSQSGGRSQY
ncbi:hypothetical protein [Spirosoma endophyticum]|uniref:Uncharacterized protein n=1 Tax=Spirosoma endophyticum TaxID=662367 RepID=A0A1I1V9Q9_9BACT|nr:hypothetical protein [Spirosoma endophyticum]SFD79752.1 hypothetical protein SAMN05216167_10797 [Spirosoma endophyticum]